MEGNAHLSRVLARVILEPRADGIDTISNELFDTLASVRRAVSLPGPPCSSGALGL